MKQRLDHYREQFKAIVLTHICESLPASEWTELRSMASDRRNFVDQNDKFDANATPASLLGEWTVEDSLSMKNTLTPTFNPKAIKVGQIDNQPVCYISGEGIYLWGLDPEDGMTLSFWVTSPAYPPGW